MRAMVAEADADGDGFIDLAEFVALNTCGVGAEAAVADIRRAFSVFDANGDGSITAEEVWQVLRSLGEKASLPQPTKENKTRRRKPIRELAHLPIPEEAGSFSARTPPEGGGFFGGGAAARAAPRGWEGVAETSVFRLFVSDGSPGSSATLG